MTFTATWPRLDIERLVAGPVKDGRCAYWCVPGYADYLKNRLFDFGDEVAGHWLLPFRAVKEKLAGRGIEVATIDMHPLESADVVVFVDLPYLRCQFDEIRAKAPQAKLVLQILETPLDRLAFSVSAEP